MKSSDSKILDVIVLFQIFILIVAVMPLSVVDLSSKLDIIIFTGFGILGGTVADLRKVIGRRDSFSKFMVGILVFYLIIPIIGLVNPAVIGLAAKIKIIALIDSVLIVATALQLRKAIRMKAVSSVDDAEQS